MLQSSSTRRIISVARFTSRSAGVRIQAQHESACPALAGERCACDAAWQLRPAAKNAQVQR